MPLSSSQLGLTFLKRVILFLSRTNPTESNLSPFSGKGQWAPKLARLHYSGSINAWSTKDPFSWIKVRKYITYSSCKLTAQYIFYIFSSNSRRQMRKELKNRIEHADEFYLCVFNLLPGLEHLNTSPTPNSPPPKIVHSIVRCLQLPRCPMVLLSLYFNTKTNGSISRHTIPQKVASLF